MGCVVSRNPANKQTDANESITWLAEAMNPDVTRLTTGRNQTIRLMSNNARLPMQGVTATIQIYVKKFLTELTFLS